MNNLRKNSGVTLIEVLVTVTIVAIGFLGLLGTQLISAKNIYGSGYRSLATIYATEMADQLRAASTQINSQLFDPESSGCDNNCDVNELIQEKIAAWQNKITAPTINGGLPNGSAAVEFDASANNYRVLILWNEQNNSDVDVRQQEFTMVVQL